MSSGGWTLCFYRLRVPAVEHHDTMDAAKSAAEGMIDSGRGYPVAIISPDGTRYEDVGTTGARYFSWRPTAGTPTHPGETNG